jgi:2-C-methyl-D-erythritol 4-phosphate cytidylyltransferase
MFSRMDVCRALIPVVPATDTLKVLDRDRETGHLRSAGERLDRSRVFGAQTPQIFRSEDLKAAYAEAYDPLFTDDASVVENIKIPLSFIEGERFNIKITTPEDLVLAEAIARSS